MTEISGMECKVVPRLKRRTQGPGGIGLFAQDQDAETVVLNVPLLKAHFNKSLRDTAKTLGVCVTAIKRVCRKFGIKEWPFRKIQTVEKKLQQLSSRQVMMRYSSKAKKLESQNEMQFKLRSLYDSRQMLLEGKNMMLAASEGFTIDCGIGKSEDINVLDSRSGLLKAPCSIKQTLTEKGFVSQTQWETNDCSLRWRYRNCGQDNSILRHGRKSQEDNLNSGESILSELTSYAPCTFTADVMGANFLKSHHTFSTNVSSHPDGFHGQVSRPSYAYSLESNECLRTHPQSRSLVLVNGSVDPSACLPATTLARNLDIFSVTSSDVLHDLEMKSECNDTNCGVNQPMHNRATPVWQPYECQWSQAVEDSIDVVHIKECESGTSENEDPFHWDWSFW